MKRMLLLTTILATAACGSEEPGRLPLGEGPVDVIVSPAARAPVVEGFPARIVSERSAQVATRMSGTVQAVLVEVGQAVRAGDALVRLDAADVSARIDAARAQVTLAERTAGRIGRLAEDGAASAAELDQATAAFEAARAALGAAEAQESYAVVRAPFAGVVSGRSVDPGDLALPGVPLLSLVAPGALKAVADLPASEAGRVGVGTPVTVRVQGRDVPLEARILRVVGALGEGARTFRVEAVLGAPAGVLSGSYARLEVERGGEGPLWIPADAVVERGQLRGVFAVEGDTLRLRWVRLGRSVAGAVELLAGPSGALNVVRSPAPELHDGRPAGSVRTEAFAGPAGSPVPQEVDR